jgi:hypothetical protein
MPLNPAPQQKAFLGCSRYCSAVLTRVTWSEAPHFFSQRMNDKEHFN